MAAWKAGWAARAPPPSRARPIGKVRVVRHLPRQLSPQVCSHRGAATPTPSPRGLAARQPGSRDRLPVPPCCLLDQSGFLVSLVTRSTSADWALPAGPGAAVAEETLQPGWALAGEGGWYWESPEPSSLRLTGTHALGAHSQTQTVGQALGREASPGALKPHPDGAELPACRAPGGWGIPEGLRLSSRP